MAKACKESLCTGSRGRRKSYLGGEVSQSLLTTQEPEHNALHGDVVVQILGL